MNTEHRVYAVLNMICVALIAVVLIKMISLPGIENDVGASSWLFAIMCFVASAYYFARDTYHIFTSCSKLRKC